MKSVNDIIEGGLLNDNLYQVLYSERDPVTEINFFIYERYHLTEHFAISEEQCLLKLKLPLLNLYCFFGPFSLTYSVHSAIYTKICIACKKQDVQ